MSLRSNAVLIAAASLLSLPPQVAAQTPDATRTATASVVAESGKFRLEAGAYKVPEVVSAVATYLERNILLAPTECSPESPLLEIQRTVETDQAGCIELLNSLLYHRSMALLTLNENLGLYEIVSLRGARRGDVAMSAKYVPSQNIAEYRNLSATPIFTSIGLQHLSANQVTNSIRPLLANSGNPLNISSGGAEQGLILAGMGNQVHTAVAIIRSLDLPVEAVGLDMRVIRLAHADATQLSNSLRQFLQSNPNHRRTTFAVDVTSNALLISASAAELSKILSLVANLDQKVENADDADQAEEPIKAPSPEKSK